MRFTAILAMALFATSAFGGSATGTITYLYQRASDNLIYVYVSGAVANRPACAAGTTYFMVRDENSATGKGQFATLLAAKVAGKAVTIEGLNTCVRWQDGEDINFILIKD
jgi:hypothetical protein